MAGPGPGGLEYLPERHTDVIRVELVPEPLDVAVLALLVAVAGVAIWWVARRRRR